jgi:hypothetical protein
MDGSFQLLTISLEAQQRYASHPPVTIFMSKAQIIYISP